MNSFKSSKKTNGHFFWHLGVRAEQMCNKGNQHITPLLP